MNRLIVKIITSVGAREFSYKSVKRPNFSNKIEHATKANNENGQISVLTKQIQTKILATGPITVAEYMRVVLTHPQGGYYMNRDVFGREGDFVTSPEISQIFGELVSIWILNEWYKLGSPAFQLIELGPGRGTLARDVLKVLAHFKVGQQFSMHLVEISPHLSTLQAQRLCYNYSDVCDNASPHYKMGETASGIKVFWYKHLEDVPHNFSIVLAHEFFDALPIHKLQLEQNVWKEVLVDVAEEKATSDFRFVLSRDQTPISKFYRPLENENRQCLEYSIESDRLIDLLAQRFDRDGGIGLIVDYGHFGDKTDTFRAFRQHKLHDPLQKPGTADLTADVDFRQMKHTAERHNQVIGCGPIDQGVFLHNMQGAVRLERLMQNALPENRPLLKSSYEMLTSSEQMGARFKFFAMFPAVIKDHLTKYPVTGFQ